MKTFTFTSVDADRLLGLGDQFIENWIESASEDTPEERAEVKERAEEWEAIKPLLIHAPEMADMLEAIRARINGEWDNPALLKWGALHPNAEQDISERIDTLLNRIHQ